MPFEGSPNRRGYSQPRKSFTGPPHNLKVASLGGWSMLVSRGLSFPQRVQKPYVYWS